MLATAFTQVGYATSFFQSHKLLYKFEGGTKNFMPLSYDPLITPAKLQATL